MSSKILLSFDAEVAHLRLNRPEKLNALDPEMLEALDAALNDVEGRSGVRALLLTAAGEKAFCVGADIHAWSSLPPLGMWSQWVRRGHQIFARLEQLPCPTVAALHGFTYGGGLELALTADLRVTAENGRFALPEVTLGTVPGWGGTERLPRLVGAGRARQMILTGQPIDAATAERWGLVNEVQPNDRCAARAAELAALIARNAPVAVKTAKQLLAGGSTATLEALASAVNAFTDDAREGLTAFREKRSPKFEGR